MKIERQVFSELARRQSYLSILKFQIRVSWIGDTCRKLLGSFLVSWGRSLRLDSFRGLGARALGTLAVDGLELHVAGGEVSHNITTLSYGCHLQDESSVWGNEAWEALGTVGVVTVLLSDFHGSNACDNSCAYPVIVRVAFSPSDMPPSWFTTPSSQPVRSY